VAQPTEVCRAVAKSFDELLARFLRGPPGAPRHVRLDVRVDVAERALEPDIEPGVTAGVVLLGMSEEALPGRLPEGLRDLHAPGMRSEHPRHGGLGYPPIAVRVRARCPAGIDLGTRAARLAVGVMIAA